jgi:hypothetical protein
MNTKSITTALRPTPGSSAALRGKVIGGAAYAERYQGDNKISKWNVLEI